jgi:hypothetical protein
MFKCECGHPQNAHRLSRGACGRCNCLSYGRAAWLWGTFWFVIGILGFAIVMRLLTGCSGNGVSNDASPPADAIPACLDVDAWIESVPCGQCRTLNCPGDAGPVPVSICKAPCAP